MCRVRYALSAALCHLNSSSHPFLQHCVSWESSQKGLGIGHPLLHGVPVQRLQLLHMFYTLLPNLHPSYNQMGVGGYGEPMSVECNMLAQCMDYAQLGLARTIYIRFTCRIFGREITKYTVIHGAYFRFWPTNPAYRSSLSHLLVGDCYIWDQNSLLHLAHSSAHHTD